MRRALAPKDPQLRCWLDQEVRADESMYFNVVKPDNGGDATAAARAVEMLDNAMIGR